MIFAPAFERLRKTMALDKPHGLRRMMTKALVLAPAIAGSVACHASEGGTDGSAWDRARAALISQGQGPMAQAIDRWKLLTTTTRLGFSDYAGFVQSYPGFPDEDRLRRSAESALEHDVPPPATLIAYFDRNPPLTNPGRAQYALALHALGRPEAAAMARAAWRGGVMGDAAETAILTNWGTALTTQDHDARIDALLWTGAVPAAQRLLPWTSPTVRAIAQGRIAALSGGDPYVAAGLPPATLDADPGFVFQRARQLRMSGRVGAEAGYLAGRPLLATQPFDRPHWIGELLAAARGGAAFGDSASTVRIAAGAIDAFAPNEDISQMSFGLRDDYTSLMWLGGTTALWRQGDGVTAANLFRRYADAARTPGTKSRGLYWAGLALTRAGRATEAQAAFADAARYNDQFYGLLALERLGQPVPNFAATPLPQPTPDERARFAALPLTSAVREVAREGDWRTTIRFFKEIAEQQQTPGQHELVAELAENIGRRDLGVIVGQAAETRGYLAFQHIAFPLIPVPPGQTGSWTMIHAIIRQESQFAQNAISHAGARGLMQMMPRTADEQAGKLGLSFSSDALIADPQFNMSVGSAYFDRLRSYFGGSYPLAVAAYNAGAGNVNKWLRANGDPRTGQVEWVDWIELIPIAETRGYVQHVLENAVVYEAMNPDKATYGGPNPLSHFLGKANPG
ncbi:lytic transglycosylase, catalytic [Novosphingobium nitrogenifigens DSM 19370]|uniref:Lytic transglycosylase, catalytic n=2 Tax=Novosphingobium nitrogenifigens TaxID=378548 RepID=F1Z820_9SPHN|nr:lytic transglycosylase, catalytic [Novosphingobium nitrogenifigens DSM 19370]